MSAPLQIEDDDGTLGQFRHATYSWGYPRTVGPQTFRAPMTTQTRVGQVLVRVYVREPGHRLPTPPVFSGAAFTHTDFDKLFGGGPVAAGWVPQDSLVRVRDFLGSVGVQNVFVGPTIVVDRKWLGRVLSILGLTEMSPMAVAAWIARHGNLSGPADAEELDVLGSHAAPLRLDNDLGDPHHVFFPPGANLIVYPSGPTNRVRVVLGGRQVFLGPWPVLVSMNDPTLVALLRQAWRTTVVVPQFPTFRMLYRIRTLNGFGDVGFSQSMHERCMQEDPLYPACQTNQMTKAVLDCTAQGSPPGCVDARWKALVDQNCMAACIGRLAAGGGAQGAAGSAFCQVQQQVNAKLVAMGFLPIDTDCCQKGATTNCVGPKTCGAAHAVGIDALDDLCDGIVDEAPERGGSGRASTSTGGGLGIAAAIVAAIAAGLYFSS